MLGLGAALVQKLSLDAYYGWLLDGAERSDRKSLERCFEVRNCLGIDAAGLAELYANTEIDELVLSSCCEAMLKAADGPPLDVASADELKYLEARLAARPGVGAAIVAAASVEV